MSHPSRNSQKPLFQAIFRPKKCDTSKIWKCHTGLQSVNICHTFTSKVTLVTLVTDVTLHLILLRIRARALDARTRARAREGLQLEPSERSISGFGTRSQVKPSPPPSELQEHFHRVTFRITCVGCGAVLLHDGEDVIPGSVD